jgi:hypothetical protein
MARISGFLWVSLSLPLIFLGTCMNAPDSFATPMTQAKYRPPHRETPLRTESAGVRLNEEYCIDHPLLGPRLSQFLPRLIFSVQTLLPIPVIRPKRDRNLSCDS